MRNHSEHFDERLEKWWRNANRTSFVDRNIAPREAIIAGDPALMFRGFDPQTTDLFFWGDEMNVQQVIDECRRILPKLQQEANKPHTAR